MHSFLIVGGDQKEREEKAKKLAKDTHPIDTVTLSPDPSIGIENIRELKKTFSLKPIKSKQKAAFIIEAQNMTIPAQNALLKTLEEPPGESLLILTAPNSDLLLLTISSRCQVINLASSPKIELNEEDFAFQWQILEKILKGGIGERLLLSEEIVKNRQEAIDWLRTQVLLWRQVLLFSNNCTGIIPNDLKGNSAKKIQTIAGNLSSKQILENLKSIEQTKKMLEQNAHVRLAIDNLLLEYPRYHP